jgi:phenolic acid decarboxylase
VQVTPHDGIANSYIWDYLNSEPVAKASNASVSQIAYTSFEADGKGNWTFAGPGIIDATSPTGGKCYLLTNGNITKSGLTSAKYIVSFWQKTGATVSITGGTNTSVAGKTINGWTYYEYTVSGATTITVSGSGYIDELRLYPSNAQMVTYTYTPLLGMTSACDADNKITYYFYDGFGRLKWIKDQDLNIIKIIQYHYQSIPGLQY